MNRVAGVVVAVLVAVVVSGGALAAISPTAQGSSSAVLPPVPAAASTPLVTLKPQNPAAIPAQPAAAPTVSAAAQSKPTSFEHPDAVPIWAPDLPPHVAAQGATAPETTAMPHTTYAVIPRNAPPPEKQAIAPAAPASIAQPAAPFPAPAQAKTATSTALPAAPRPAAAPTAVAAIVLPSSAHADYLRIGGMTIGERRFDQDDYAATRDPSNWIVRIFKHDHRLEVYYRDNLYKSYHAVFGRSLWPGAKEVENDRRTPEGDYMIVQKHPSRRFDWFLKINYPNAEDRAHFEELRDEGKIPMWEREGGQVGIHGTDNPILNVGDINWTTGCISIDNDDIAELARLLPIGTTVIIKP